MDSWVYGWMVVGGGVRRSGGEERGVERWGREGQGSQGRWGGVGWGGADAGAPNTTSNQNGAPPKTHLNGVKQSLSEASTSDPDPGNFSLRLTTLSEIHKHNGFFRCRKTRPKLRGFQESDVISDAAVLNGTPSRCNRHPHVTRLSSLNIGSHPAAH